MKAFTFTLFKVSEGSDLFDEATANYSDHLENIDSFWAVLFDFRPEPTYFAQTRDGYFIHIDHEGSVLFEGYSLNALCDYLAGNGGRDFLTALENFKLAFVKLNREWGKLPPQLADLVNEGQYPFDRSFDEFDVAEWVSSIEQLFKNKDQ